MNTSYIPINIDSVSDFDVSGQALSDRIYIISVDQIDRSRPFPKPNLKREISSLPLKSGEVMHYLDCHVVPTLNSKGDKGDLTVNATNDFVVVLGGSRPEVLNFIERGTGRKFLLLFKVCGEDNWKLLGTPCKPMVFKSFDHKNDKDSRSVTCTFSNASIVQYHIYTGPIVESEPAKNPDGTALTIKSGTDQYLIPDGSGTAKTIATVSGLSAADEGRQILLIGEGATNAASIEANAVFILKGGTKWTAKAGATITFQVLSKNQLVEVSRSEQ
ncbi:MAG: hypothetical protein SPI35_05940 [Porphyromonas sp.]|nr:hypothetical protein [Porphyromonas sp.]